MKKKQKRRKLNRPNPKRPTSTAIVKAESAPIAHWKERRFTQEQIDLLKRTVAKGTDNDQFTLFMQVCQKHGLDPFVKEIYCVMFPVSKHHQDQKGIWVSGFEMVIITGIGGYRKMAARDHKDYAGSSDGAFTWPTTPKTTPAGRKIPESVTVRVHRRGAEDTLATVYWDEFAPADLGAARSDFWNRMPKNQLEKCAEAKGLRKAFPGLGDVFVEEEMQQRLQDLTPAGREIVLDGGVAPSGRPVTWEAQNRAQIGPGRTREMPQEGFYCAKHQCAFSKCPADEHTQAELDAMWALEQAAKKKPAPHTIDVTPTTKAAEAMEKEQEKPKPMTKKPDPKPIETKYTLTIDWSLDRNAPVLTGQVSELAGFLPKDVTLEWKGELWHAKAKDIPAIMQAAGQNSFLVKEIQFNQVPPGGQQRSAPPPARKPAAREGAVSSSAAPAAGPSIVSGTIERVNTGMAGKNPVKHVTMLVANGTKPTYSCFDKKLFDALDAGLGKQAELVTKQNGNYTNIIGAKKIGSKEWDTDGTPVIQRNREAGTPKLWE